MSAYAVYAEMAGFAVYLAFLAVVLSVVGYGVRTLLSKISASRTESKMKSEALVAAARTRANARAQARVAC